MARGSQYDDNNNYGDFALSNSDGKTPVPLWANPTTHELLVSATSGLVPSAFDYIAYTNTSSTVDTYVFKTGGSGGTTVATITITYTDTTKTQVSTVART